MSPLALLLLALVLPCLGVFVTVLLARRIPLSVLARAGQHGRFAHLESVETHGGPVRATPARQPAVPAGLRTA